MIKKIFLFLLLFVSFWNFTVLADSIPVENVFLDINKDYKYYNQLQTLYDKWMISPDVNWRFNPQELLNRDDFVGITMEVSCKKCISPETSYEFIKKYSTKELFFDLNRNNKNFYCIAEAENSWNVSWYHEWTACENWTSKDWEKPFCPDNTIILEEAIAIILRTSGILTNQQAAEMRLSIANWNITESLSDDVSPLNIDGSVYSFYPDIKKALEYEVVDFDKNWNKQVYKLINVKDWKIRPKQAISKEKFLQIAYVALKANSCQEKVEDKIWLDIDIFDKSCNESISWTCNFSDLSWKDKIYDFKGNVWISAWDSINEDTWYIWRFYNYLTWEEIKKYWKYIDNHDFLNDWKYRVYFRAITENWKTGEVYADIQIGNWSNLNIWENNDFKVSIDADPISWTSPLLVIFKGIASWNSYENSYYWNFWDWTSWFWEEVNHIYKEVWIYKVKLSVTDKNNNTVYSTALINVLDEDIKDSDSDWVIDQEDYQIFTPLDKINYICTKDDISLKKYDCLSKETLWVYSELKDSSDTDRDGVSDDNDNEINTPSDKINYICTQIDINAKKYWCITQETLGVYSKKKELWDEDKDWVLNIYDYQIRTPSDKINYICTQEDIDSKKYDCLTPETLWVYSEKKENSDLDWDWVIDENDYQIRTPSDKINYICTQEDIDSKKYDCLTPETLWVYSEKKEVSVVWDFDNDGVSDISDLCPDIKWSEKNKWCPIFDDLCSENSDCNNWFYCATWWVCSPKSFATSCEYKWWDLVYGNVVCNSCPCSNKVDFNSTIRECDIVFPAITSPDQSTIYSRWNYFQIKK